MRMIEANKMIKAMLGAGMFNPRGFERSQDFAPVWDVPVVDAEQVTRCEDCFWSMRASLTDADLGYDCTLLKLRRLPPDFFCKDGRPDQQKLRVKADEVIQRLHTSLLFDGAYSEDLGEEFRRIHAAWKRSFGLEDEDEEQEREKGRKHEH